MPGLWHWGLTSVLLIFATQDLPENWREISGAFENP